MGATPPCRRIEGSVSKLRNNIKPTRLQCEYEVSEHSKASDHNEQNHECMHQALCYTHKGSCKCGEELLECEVFEESQRSKHTYQPNCPIKPCLCPANGEFSLIVTSDQR